MRVVRVGLLVTSVIIPGCPAGDVSFLPDGKSLARSDKGVLLLKDLNDEFPESEIKLPEAMREDTPALAHTAGRLVVVGSDRVMTWNPASKEWKELWKMPDDKRVDDVACDPKSGDILFVTHAQDDSHRERDAEWLYLPKGETQPAKVFNRRAPAPLAPCFDAEGHLYFVCHGDVWKGGIEKGEFPETPFVLFGKRLWPIADLETDSSSRHGGIAEEVLPFGGQLLIHLDYSSSSGALVRVPNVDPYEKGLPIKWQELMGDSGYAPLAISPDGKTAAAWVQDSRRWWVMEKPDGSFEPLSREGHHEGP